MSVVLAIYSLFWSFSILQESSPGKSIPEIKVYNLCSRGRQMVVHSAFKTRLSNRVLRSIRCLHICSRRILGVFPTATAMDTIDVGKYFRHHFRLANCCGEESEYYSRIPILPDVSLRHVYHYPGDNFPFAVRCHNHCL